MVKNKGQTSGDKKDALKGLELSIGTRIRQRRTELGITQLQLARLLGLSYQQVQKYETGLNRISAGRLYQISRFLFVDVGYFFKGLTCASESGKKTDFEFSVIRLAENHLDQSVQRAIANLVAVMGKQIH